MSAGRYAPWRDALLWAALGFVALVLVMPLLKPVFAALFPQLERPLYEQDSFVDLAAWHVALVALSSALSAAIGVAAGIFVTRPLGAEFRSMVETVTAAGQSFPPVAVLAIAVPVIGFGAEPALIALTLYGLLPVLANTIAGIGAVAPAVREAARGIGMSEATILRQVELPLAAPIIIAGIRTSSMRKSVSAGSAGGRRTRTTRR